MSASLAPQLIRCLYGPSAIGGQAEVHWLPGHTSDELNAIATVRSEADANATVRTFVINGEDRYRVESYSAANRRIHFCGHGALAAAFVMFERQPHADTLEFMNANQAWQAKRAGNDITLFYNKPAVVPCAVPEFVAEVLGADPLACAEAGGPADYLIVELPDADAVRELQPDFAGLSAASQRALIVTAVAEHSGHAGCVFRYFAPRYGTPEDPATGSAAVQLAAFWSPRFAGSRFQARQLSLQGAEMWLACNGNVVELTARVGYC